MIDLKNVKLVVWDLDDTFWKGTISEGDVARIPENISLVRMFTDCGIVNSICSKNEYDIAWAELKKEGIEDLFVFVSINWDNKAMRLKNIIEKMALRPINVLFIDDNHFNLEEAKYFMPDLMTIMPSELPAIYDQIRTLPTKDESHKRLNQYKVLEEKIVEAQKYNSNEEFLFSSNIRVEIKEDCLNELVRIHELLMRSNQLNYTKKRISVQELKDIILDKNYKCGYVHVVDRFGDYGIVGFYAMKDNFLEHFLFSCRTMGQLIEQYVYAYLGYPDLQVVGEVRTILNKTECPKWINQTARSEDSNNIKEVIGEIKILIKGPCDLSRAIMYLQNANKIDSELTYVKDASGQSVFAHNHSAQILNEKLLSDKEAERMFYECPFVDPQSFNSKMFSGQYDVIFLSSLLESDHGIYQKKDGKAKVVIGNYKNDITDPSMWEHCVTEGESYFRFSKKQIETFSNAYKFVGYTTPDCYVNSLSQILSFLPEKTVLCIILGATKNHPSDFKKMKMHEDLNNAVIAYAKTQPRIKYIEVDKCIESSRDFAEYINHYQARVYYKIALEITRVANECVGANRKIEIVGGGILFLDEIMNKIKPLFNRDGKLYKTLLRIYRKITGR